MGFKLPSISSIVTDGISAIANSADKIIDDFVLDPIEKSKAKQALINETNRNQEALIDKANDVEKAYLADTQDARDSNAKIQESLNASWLSKNVLYILALTVTTGFFGLMAYLLMYEVPAGNKDIINILLGSLGTAWITIIGFFFGSSMGSKKAGDRLDKIIDQNK